MFALALGAYGCIGPLELADFVDLERDRARVPNAPLVTLARALGGLPPDALETLLDSPCTGFVAEPGAPPRLVTAGDRVRVLDANDGTLLAAFGSADPTQARNLLACTPDRTLLAVSDAARLTLVDTATASARATITLPHLQSVAVSPEGALVVATTRDATLVLAADDAAPRAVLDLVTPSGSGGEPLAFAPDGNTLAAIDARTGELTLWPLGADSDAPPTRLALPLRPTHLHFAAPHLLVLSDATTEPCTTLAVDLDTLVARAQLPADSACDSSAPHTTERSHDALRALADPAGLAVFERASDQPAWQVARATPIDAIAFFDDAPNLVVRSRDGTVRTWDPTARDKILLDERDDGHAGAPVALTHDARQAVYGPPTSDETDGPTAIAVSGASSGDGGGELAVHVAGEIIVKSLASGRIITRFSPRPLSEGSQPPRLGAIALAPDAEHLAVTYRAPSGDSGVALIELAQQRIVYELLDAGEATAVAFLDDRHYVTGHANGAVVLRAVSGARPIAQLDAHAPVSAVGASRRGHLVAAGLADGTLVLWSPEDNRTRALLDGHNAAITAIGFATLDDVLASGDAVGRTVLWSSHLDGGTAWSAPAAPAAVAGLAPRVAQPLTTEALAAGLGRYAGSAVRAAVARQARR